MNNHEPLVSLSIVSHGQASLIRFLLADLEQLAQQDFEVILTINLPEDESPYQNLSFPLQIIRNSTQKGFGANHNTAFTKSKGKFFAIVNPDIRITAINFQKLISPFKNSRTAAVAPIILSGDGKIEDSARRFPTLFRLAKRVLLQQRDPDYKLSTTPFSVDWLAGMFILFRPEAYRKINGFDDRRFFMYLEDADICRRLHKKGWQVMLNPNEKVTHMAQRASHRNLKHLRWHTVSAIRYLTGL